MKLTPVTIALRSLLFHKRESFYQYAIICLLTAIICGSLLTGFSVRKSLSRNLEEKTVNADVLISSGLRYFNPLLAGRFTGISGLKSAAIIETDGFCRNFSSGETALGVKVLGLDSAFFTFNGIPAQKIPNGNALLNETLAGKLDLKPGDEIILGFNGINPLPANAPFAPEENYQESSVLKVLGIIPGQQAGNFSLGSNQSIPLNIFVNPEDLLNSGVKSRANRLLVGGGRDYDLAKISQQLRGVINPEDEGLGIRISGRTKEPEIISDRIFIDSMIVEDITRQFISAEPVITYLANSFGVRTRRTPYSFIAALPPAMIPGLKDDEIIIGRWLAEDLGAVAGDTLTFTWFDPVSGKYLREDTCSLRVKGIAEYDFKYSDPSLMPEFPGISGSTTCSSWDAGVKLDMDRIRQKDEDYWTMYKGTPKAFISYNAGKRLWGNNFGPATAIRFEAGTDTSLIIKKIKGNIDPFHAGFSVTDLKSRNFKAATEGVDFGMLFLSLSIFIIVSCLVLLSMALNIFLDSRKNEVRAYHAVGFSNRKITRMISYEAFMVAVMGSLSGVFLGYLVNILIIKALNGVWTGAVQTDTLKAGFGLIPLVTGFAAALIISVILIMFRIRSSLRELSKGSKEIYRSINIGKNNILMLLAISAGAVTLAISVVLRNSATMLAFAGGVLLFAGMVLAARGFFAGRRLRASDYSGLYYSYYPSKAVAPVVFLAAGIFAVLITGANRQVVTDKMTLPAGGTGGYLLWSETVMPVKQDLNSREGRYEFGFDEGDLATMNFIQAKKLRGDDASCLNITHVTAPPILGIDPQPLIDRGSFSFATSIKKQGDINPWSMLDEEPGDNIIYGIADQTVLQWGLKLKTGDTLKYISENGKILNIVLCAGLKSSVFQGHLLIGYRSFEKYFPSVSGNSVFLVDGKKEFSELYKEAMLERLAGYGISVEPAIEKLASFFQVTNTYLDVFMMMGALGMILGVAGLGFILIRNFNSRKREFALMLASGYTEMRIRKLLLKDHFYIVLWGIFTGSVSALCATWPSVSGGTQIPWLLFMSMLILIFAIGYIVLSLSVRSVNRKELIVNLRHE